VTRRRWVFLVGLSMALIAADQGTKWWAATTLAERRVERSRPACDQEGEIARRARYRPLRQVHVIEGLFSLRYVENCAGAFGILSDQNESVRRPFFLAVSLAAIIFIVLLFKRLREDQVMLMWALPFVLGGALGNLIDRIHLRYVIDFIDWYHESIGRWPTFNIADAAIVVGVGLILLDMFPKRGAKEKEASAKKSEASKEPSDSDSDSDSDDRASTPAVEASTPSDKED
jgi:signal peptidase II